MADAVKMVVANGVRFRPEDAPEQQVETKATEPKNKSRRPANKSVSAGDK